MIYKFNFRSYPSTIAQGERVHIFFLPFILNQIFFLLITLSKFFPPLVLSLSKHTSKYLLGFLILSTLQINSHALIDKAQPFIDREEFEQAILILEQSDHLPVQFMLGTLYTKIGNISHAIDTYNELLKKHPTNPQILYNLGYTLKCSGFLDEAIAIFKTIIKLQPEHEQAHLALAFSYLMKGDYETGWTEHAWNLRRQKKDSGALRRFLQENSLSQKRILLRPEGGLGDTIQFIRYAKRLHDLGAFVIAYVQPALLPLLRNLPYVDQFVDTTANISYDAQTTFMSLPAILHDKPETMASTIPYIFADQNLVEKWKNKVAHNKKFKIGICWQPSVHNDKSRIPIARRGVPLILFKELNNLNISWYSLQKVDGLEQLSIAHELNLIQFDSFDEEAGAFMDSAALINSLDLVISTDTAIAHIAGALGKDVWLLEPYVTDWRWIYHSTTTPWYPTMKVFKQPHPFDWKSVVEQLKHELERIMRE